MGVECQKALGGAAADAEGDEVALRPMLRLDGADVDVGEDVDVVHQYVVAAGEEGCGMLEAAAGVEQKGALVADVDGAVPLAGADEVGDHVGEVVHVDNDVADAGAGEGADGVLEERDARDFDQCLGTVVGEWAQAGAETRG